MNPVPTPVDIPEILVIQLRDLHSAKSQLILTLSRLREVSSHPRLRELLEAHEKDSAAQNLRLRGIFQRLGADPEGEICTAMKGLIQGGLDYVARIEAPASRDLVVIAQCNRIKHYEIAGYRFAASLAGCLGLTGEAETINRNLALEVAFVERLSAIVADVCPTVRESAC